VLNVSDALLPGAICIVSGLGLTSPYPGAPCIVNVRSTFILFLELQ
jgi:hypothetical protein